MTIPNLTPQRLQKIKRVVALIPSRFDRDIDVYNDFHEAIQKLGFKAKDGYNYEYIFYHHKRWKLVVKSSYVLGRKPTYSVPTLPIRYNRDESLRVVIQPYVRTSGKAIDMVYDKTMNLPLNIVERHYGCDVHPSNLGLYKGKVVAFDW